MTPFAVTVAALGWVFSKIELQSVLEQLDFQTLAILLPVLVIFCGVALWIEAECLVRLLPESGHVFDRATAARIKAASYPLSLIHYAIGAGGLAMLLSRRTGRSIAEAAGVVALILLFDIGIQLLMLVAGITALGTDAPAVQASVAFAMIGAIVLGLLGLRTRVSLGPLDRIRSMSVFAAARTTPLPLLAELGALRLVFGLIFLVLIGAACRAFGVLVPWAYLLASVPLLLIAAMVPSVAGLGTGQIAFLEIFKAYGDKETLLACSLALSAGMLVLRATMGLVFAREFTREALVAAREVETSP